MSDVNAVLVEVRRGADSKLYPAHPLPKVERWRAVNLAHRVRCRDGLSIRQVRRVMAQQFGVRRTVGSIARDLALFTCSRCEDRS
jgi:hypothetical protein